MQYRPDIDGLRAVAVVPVVLYHAGFAAFAGGFVGVDVFFVISGYLITSLIFGEIKTGEFTFRGFYVRRIRRLFPALFAVVLVSCVPAYFLLLPQELEDFGQSVATLALFSSNILFWSEAGYFANAAELKPLLHTWSLAIEEQYYLLFPALLLLVRRMPGAPFVAVTSVVFCASLLLSALTVDSSPQAAFYLLPSRTWELLLGSLIAMTSVSVGVRWLRELLALAGLAAIGYAVFTFSAGMAFPGLAALVPCVGTALLIVTARHTPTFASRVLSDKKLVFIGLLSYSLYLWHWPMLVFAKHYFAGPLAVSVTLALVAASFAVSYLSWRFIERPFRGAGAVLSARQLFRGAAAMIVLLIAVGLVFDESEGLPGRLPAEATNILAAGEDRPANRRRCEGIAPAELSLSRLCKLNDLDAAPSMLVWGDSHANMLVPAIAQAAGGASRNGVFAVANGCVPLLGVRRSVQDTHLDCERFNAAVFELIEAHPALEVIVLAARWGLHADGTPYGDHTGASFLLRDAERTAASSTENRAMFSAALVRTLAALDAPGRRVVLVGSVPEVGQHLPDTMAKRAWRGNEQAVSVATSSFMARQAPVHDAIAAARAGAEFVHLPLHTSLCGPRQCAVTEQGMPLYFDDNHLGGAGVRRILPVFSDLFAGEIPE